MSIRQELLLPDDDPDADANSGISPIVIKCRKIQQVLLQRHDPDLYEHFEALQVWSFPTGSCLFILMV